MRRQLPRIMLAAVLLVGALAIMAPQLDRGPAAPAGGPPDPARGRLVFEREGCVACHTTTTELRIGPGMAGVLEPAGPVYPPGVDYGGRLPNGEPRTPEALAAYIRATTSGQIGLMPGRDIGDGDMADLLAFLATLEREE